jgi:hypothetical protein
MGMKDYYQILQVIPQAEPEVIEAAYRRLIRKYHPDVLLLAEQDSEQALRRAQELNEAYEVLGNVERRQAYDELLKHNLSIDEQPEPAGKPVPVSQKSEVEQRSYLVRCGATKRTFKMTLGRRKGWTGPFVVMGFELVNDYPSVPSTEKSYDGFWGKVHIAITGTRSKSANLPAQDMSPTEQEVIQNLFDMANTLSLGDIDWSGHKCPDCASEITNANGTRATWSMCGTCHRLKCVGSAEKKLGGYYSTCPWCGTTNKITRSIPTGSKDQAIIHGKYSTEANLDLPKFADKDPKRLNKKGGL